MMTKYNVTLTDYENDSVPHEVPKDEVASFIAGINWDQVVSFTVSPIEYLAQWEIDLLNGGTEEESDELKPV